MSTQFALDLRLARRKSGLTQCDVAHLTGSDQATIAKLENGKRMPSVPQVCLFSLIFGKSFESLFAEQLNEAGQQLQANLPGLPANGPVTPATFNRESSLKRLERRLADQATRL
jgi:transcriptional regulator with XRE-family HTH domain